MKKIILCLFLSGCAPLNFSSKYYSPPINYQQETLDICNNTIESLKKAISIGLEHTYTVKITRDSETKIAGIPQIDANNCVSIPEYLIKYIYEFYPNYRHQILASVICHELAHQEFNLPSSPPQTHYLVDKKAIEFLLPKISLNANDFYNTLRIIQDYWSARKGAAGHLFNMTWNAINLALITYGGSGSIGDLYATDIKTRLGLLRKDYKVAFTYKRYR